MVERNNSGADQDFFTDIFDDQAFESLGPEELALLREHAVTRVNLFLNDSDPTPDIGKLEQSRMLCEETGIRRDLVLLVERHVEDELMKGAKAEVMQLEGHTYRVIFYCSLAARARVKKSTP